MDFTKLKMTQKVERKVKKVPHISLRKDIIKLGLIDHFNEDLIDEANDLFNLVKQSLSITLRGERRRAVVFACIYYSGKMIGEYNTPYNLMETFSLTTPITISTCRKGIKIVESVIGIIPAITTEDIICDIIVKNYSQIEQIDEVMKLYTEIENKSSLLNSTFPKTLAAALVKVWSTRKGLPEITLTDYASGSTIRKVVKEVERVLK